METISKTTVETGNPNQSPMDFFAMSGSTFMADGPLAREMSQALDILFKKETGPDGMVLEQVALETQQQDGYNEQQLWLAAHASMDQLRGDGIIDTGMLYGVKQQQLAVSDLINVTDAVSQMSDQERLASAVIIQTAGVAPGTHPTPVQAALEALCERKGIMIYSSLNQFLKRHG